MLRLMERLLRGTARDLRRASGLAARRDWPALKAAILARLEPRAVNPPADIRAGSASPLDGPMRMAGAAATGLGARVAVVVAGRGDGTGLAGTVRSALDQTYPHIEVIVVEDGPVEPQTRESVDAMAGPRLRVHRLDAWEGRPAAWNRGAALSDADCLMFLDAGDRPAPVAVAVLLVELEANPDRAFACCPRSLSGAAGPTGDADPRTPYDLLWADDPPACAMVRADWFRRASGFRPEMLFGGEDRQLQLALSAIGGRGLYVPVPVIERSRPEDAAPFEARRLRRFLATQIRRLSAPLYRPEAIAERKAAWRPLVSVIIPFYNGHRFLDETLAALDAQTTQDFEVILVNDGSEHPDSLRMLERLRQRAGLRVLDRPHRGLPATRNAGARAARTEHIFYLDSDDLLDPTALEKLALAAAARPEVAFVYSGVVHFGEIEGICIDPFDRERLTRENYLAFSCLIRREVYIAVGGMDEALTDCYEDYDFWLRLIDAGHEGYLVPEPLFLYRRHGLGNRTKLTRQTTHEEMLERLRARNPGLYGGPPIDRSGWALMAAGPAFPGLTAETRALADAWRRHAGEAGAGADRRADPPLPFPPAHWTDPRIGVLYVVPQCADDDAGRIDLNILEGLARDRFRVTVLVERDGEHPWLDRYKALAGEAVRLSALAPDEEGRQAVCLYYAMARAADLVVVRGSGIGYRFVERLKALTGTVRTVELLHADREDPDRLRASLLHHELFDRRFAATDEAARLAARTGLPEAGGFETIPCGGETARERCRAELAGLASGLDRDERLADYQLRLMEAPLFLREPAFGHVDKISGFPVAPDRRCHAAGQPAISG